MQEIPVKAGCAAGAATANSAVTDAREALPSGSIRVAASHAISVKNAQSVLSSLREVVVCDTGRAVCRVDACQAVARATPAEVVVRVVMVWVVCIAAA
jgi:hypothetical protein